MKGLVLMTELPNTVSSTGAVSPITLATASMTPVMMPGSAVGSTIRTTVIHLAPSLIRTAACRPFAGRYVKSRTRRAWGGLAGSMGISSLPCPSVQRQGSPFPANCWA